MYLHILQIRTHEIIIYLATYYLYLRDFLKECSQ